MSLRLWQFISAEAPADFVILDIGAFEGEFALLARKVNKSSEIYAFEPNPQSVKKLKLNCKDNEISILGIALFSENTTVQFECNSQISAITKSDDSKNSVSVEAITLDSWINKTQKRPLVIKIDVEDAVVDVLRGSKATIRNHRPIIICEILDDKAGELVKTMLPPDYDLYLINENEGLEIKSIVKRYDWRYKNWFFVPSEMDHLIRDFVCA